jgi:hypothetical protein
MRDTLQQCETKFVSSGNSDFAFGEIKSKCYREKPFGYIVFEMKFTLLDKIQELEQ